MLYWRLLPSARGTDPQLKASDASEATAGVLPVVVVEVDNLLQFARLV